MADLCSVELCMGCGLCALVCPRKCIEMHEDKGGFLYPHIQADACVNCGLCSRTCPQDKEIARYGEPPFLYAWHKNREVRAASSSGGVFSALAAFVFRRGGVVFGVTEDGNEGGLAYCEAENEAELAPMRLSKYYQCTAAPVFPVVRERLLSGRTVLFTGVACQIAALYQYLGNLAKSDMLWTMDVLCHGVASRKTVDAYIQSKERQQKKTVRSYAFRVKDSIEGWRDGSGTRMFLHFADGTEAIQDKHTDTFFVGFNQNIFLRESCYHCRYCGTERLSDFTVADYWGVSLARVSADEQKQGVSLLLPNSERAQKAVDELSSDMITGAADRGEAIHHNLALIRANRRPASRDVFFDLMDKKGFDYAVRHLNRKYYRKIRIKLLLRSILPKKLYDSLVNRRQGKG